MPIGPTELIIVLVIVMIIFGAGKLPQVLGSLGKGVKEFREASEGKEGEPGTNATGTTSTVSTTSAAPSSGVATPGVAAQIPNTINTAGIPTPIATVPPAPAEKTSDTMSTS